jgi:hypothetical protein
MFAVAKIISSAERCSQAPAKLLRRDSSLREHLTDGFDLSLNERLKPFDFVVGVFQECPQVQIDCFAQRDPEVPREDHFKSARKGLPFSKRPENCNGDAVHLGFLYMILGVNRINAGCCSNPGSSRAV